MSSLPLLAPLFLVFETVQLLICERYVGLKQIARGANPREMGPSEPISFALTAGMIFYGAWTLALLAYAPVRVYAIGLIGVTVLGYGLRRNCSLKRILIVLTFEGAARIGFLSTLSFAAWFRV